MEVASGSTDACVIDITMANAMTGEGTSYKDLAIACEALPAMYGVPSEPVPTWLRLIEAPRRLLADGTLDRLAESITHSCEIIPKRT